MAFNITLQKICSLKQILRKGRITLAFCRANNHLHAIERKQNFPSKYV